MSTPLPRSLAPLPDESLPGFLLRLSHRLDLSPAQLAAITGLAPHRSVTIPAGRMLALSPDLAEDFAHATRLSLDEVHALTMAGLTDRYPPLDLQFTGRHRRTHGIFVKENWILSRSTRYCPDCLAGDGSLIQQRHGGAFSKLWRLPVVFACPTHRRLLHHTCPACRDPVHHRAAAGAQLLPLPTDASLHPAACRNPLTPPGQRRPSPCAHRLDSPIRAHPADDHHQEQLLHLQQRLLDMLHPNGPTTTTSVGAPTTPARFFVDLRILTCLIAASWPAARHLVADPAHVNLINRHIRDTRHAIEAIRRSDRAVRELALYDRPPLPADACAALLTLADRITAGTDPDTVGYLLRPMVTAAPTIRSWTRQFLAGDGYCSPGLQTALGREVGATHIIERSGPPPRPAQPSPPPVRFGIQHVPAHALPEWREQHFAPFADVTAHLLGRAISIRLAQITTGGSAAHAGTLLGIPRSAAHYAATDVPRQLGRRQRDLRQGHRRPRPRPAHRHGFDQLRPASSRPTRLDDHSGPLAGADQRPARPTGRRTILPPDPLERRQTRPRRRLDMGPHHPRRAHLRHPRPPRPQRATARRLPRPLRAHPLATHSRRQARPLRRPAPTTRRLRRPTRRRYRRSGTTPRLRCSGRTFEDAAHPSANIDLQRSKDVRTITRNEDMAAVEIAEHPGLDVPLPETGNAQPRPQHPVLEQTTGESRRRAKAIVLVAEPRSARRADPADLEHGP